MANERTTGHRSQSINRRGMCATATRLRELRYGEMSCCQKGVWSKKTNGKPLNALDSRWDPLLFSETTALLH
jgi:hypothetical protein